MTNELIEKIEKISKNYWELYSKIKEVSTNQADFNTNMLIARELFLRK